jgi:hypothetical protein
VTGDVNAAALEDLVRLCVELNSHRGAGAPDTSGAWAALEQAGREVRVRWSSGTAGACG